MTTVRGFKPHFWKAELTPKRSPRSRTSSCTTRPPGPPGALSAVAAARAHEYDRSPHHATAPYGSGNGCTRRRRNALSALPLRPADAGAAEGRDWPAPRPETVRGMSRLRRGSQGTTTVAAWRVVASIALARFLATRAPKRSTSSVQARRPPPRQLRLHHLRQAQRDLRARTPVLVVVRGLLCDAHLPSRREDAQPTQPHVGRAVRAESRRPQLLGLQDVSDLGDAARPDARRAFGTSKGSSPTLCGVRRIFQDQP